MRLRLRHKFTLCFLARRGAPRRGSLTHAEDHRGNIAVDFYKTLRVQQLTSPVVALQPIAHRINCALRRPAMCIDQAQALDERDKQGAEEDWRQGGEVGVFERSNQGAGAVGLGEVLIAKRQLPGP